MSKDKKIILGLVGIIIFLLGFFYFQNEKEISQKREGLAVFVKEHNASIIMGNDLDNQEDDVVKVIDFSTDESNSQEEALEIKEDFSERKILPYTKSLPELPNEEENNSTLYGVDSNGNGVRDDLEIAIVKEFGDNSERTEYMLASFRYRQRIFELAERGVDNDVYQYLFSRANTLVGCSSPKLGSGDKAIDLFFKKDNYLEKEIFFNTSERKFANEKAKNNMRSFFGGSTGSKEECEKYIKESILDMDKDLYNLNN